MTATLSPPQPTVPSIVYELDKVSFGYQATVPALSDLSLDIRAGEKVAVVGANGAGKSTLLRILAGQLLPLSGRYRAFGTVVACGPPAQPQGNGFAGRVALVTSRFDTTLSEGQKKRVSLGAMLAFQPPVILLDEPMNALDGPGRRWLLGVLKELKAGDKTVIIGTYDLALSQLVTDRMIVLSDQHTLLADGRTSEIAGDTDLLVRAGLLHEHTHTHGGTTHRHFHPLLPQEGGQHHEGHEQDH
jgi:cobalt/nickel transport system ATP-binding protein